MCLLWLVNRANKKVKKNMWQAKVAAGKNPKWPPRADVESVEHHNFLTIWARMIILSSTCVLVVNSKRKKV